MKFDARGALNAVLADGAAHVPSAVEDDVLDAIQEEIEIGPFESAPEEVGPVRQRTVTYTISWPMSTYPSVRAVADELTSVFRATGVGALSTWRPNEAAVQRYRPGPIGISPHLDGRRHRALIALLTTHGNARFALHATRDGGAIREWAVGPGDLVLVRAPGLGGRDGRPFHSITAPSTGERYSVGFRMNTKP